MLKQILRPLAKKYATHYFCCSEVAGRWQFGNKEFDEGNVYTLNNAIDLDKYKYDKNIRQKQRKDLNIKDDIFVIGHIGRFMPVKNHKFIIEVFNEIHKENKNTLLLLAGQGPLTNEIKMKTKELGLTRCVKFLGQRSDANELYQAFDTLFFPSLYEGLGMVPIEAQVSGLPCVVSSQLPNIVKITDNLEFLELDDTINTWKNTILDKVNKERKSHSIEVKKAGYDIKTEVKKLEKKYIELSK